jgi:hypothetical protein
VPGRNHTAPDALSHQRYTDNDEETLVPRQPYFDDDETTLAPPFNQAEEGRGAMLVGMVSQRDKEQEIQDIMCFLQTFKPPVTTPTKERQRFLGKAVCYYLQGNHLY